MGYFIVLYDFINIKLKFILIRTQYYIYSNVKKVLYILSKLNIKINLKRSVRINRLCLDLKLVSYSLKNTVTLSTTFC